MQKFLTYIMAVCTVICVSCKKDPKELIHTVTTFSVQISCIAPSHSNNHVFWIGLDNGDVVRINIMSNEQNVLKAGNNRIYDVLEENDSIIWVGVRDGGLKKIVYDSKSYEIKEDSTYYVKRNDNTITKNYSVYSVAKKNDTLYLSTSWGVYKLNTNERNDSPLTRFFPGDKKEPFHYGVNSLLIIGDSLYCAAASGLIVLDKTKNYDENDKKELIKGNFNHLFLSKDSSTLWATSETKTYEIDLKNRNNRPKSIKCSEQNRFAFIECEDGKKWLLTSNSLKYKDKKGETISEFSLPLRLESNYKNIIHKGKDFILLSCGKYFFKFSLHQNPERNPNNNIIAATSDGDTYYFITNTIHLYYFKMDETPKDIGKVGIDKGSKIEKMIASKNFLWIITDKTVYRIDKKTRNPFSTKVKTEKIITQENDKDKKGDFKSIYFDVKENNLFIGSRHYLYMIKNPDYEKINPTDIKQIDDQNKYIIDIIRIDSKVFFASLNKGVFMLNNPNNVILDSIKNSKRIGNIRKFVNQRYLHTSHGVYNIFGIDELKFKTDTFHFELINACQLRYVSSLFSQEKNHDCFFIGHSGVSYVSEINDISHDLLSHFDLSFNSAAFVPTKDGKVLLGSEFGLYIYDEKIGLQSISFDDPRLIAKPLKIIIIALLIILLVTVFVFVTQSAIKTLRKKVNKLEVQINTKVKKEEREDLHKELNLIKKPVEKRELGKIFRILSQNKLKKLQIKVDEKSITTHRIISEIKGIIDNKKEKFNFHDSSDIDSINASYKRLDELLDAANNELNSLKTKLVLSKTDELIALFNEIIDLGNCEKMIDPSAGNAKLLHDEINSDTVFLKEETIKWYNTLSIKFDCTNAENVDMDDILAIIERDDFKEVVENNSEKSYIILDDLIKVAEQVRDKTKDLLNSFHKNELDTIDIDESLKNHIRDLRSLFEENKELIYKKIKENYQIKGIENFDTQKREMKIFSDDINEKFLSLREKIIRQKDIHDFRDKELNYLSGDSKRESAMVLYFIEGIRPKQIEIILFNLHPPQKPKHVIDNEDIAKLRGQIYNSIEKASTTVPNSIKYLQMLMASRRNR